jgi:hypothetical protein
MLGVPVRGYAATSRRLDQKEWEDSIRWSSTKLKIPTWTKITGEIGSWPQYNHDGDDVFDLHSDIDVLVQWGTVDYFEARGTAWMFRCSLEVPALSASLEVPPQSAEDEDFLRMTSKAFHAAAGPKDVWPRGIAFLAVHCEIQELMSADPAHAVRIPGPVVAPWHIPWYIPDFWYILYYMP